MVFLVLEGSASILFIGLASALVFFARLKSKGVHLVWCVGVQVSRLRDLGLWFRGSGVSRFRFRGFRLWGFRVKGFRDGRSCRETSLAVRAADMYLQRCGLGRRACPKP